MGRFISVLIFFSVFAWSIAQSGIGGGGQSNVSGGGAGSSSGGGNMPGVFNLINYGGVDDDSTDNCANGSVAAFTTAVNAYSGPGQPVAIIPSGSSNKAYKLATAACNFIFTIPVTVHLWGNIDCAQPATTANCIQFGATGMGSLTNAQIFPYRLDGGGTLTGGVNLTNGGIEIEPNTVNSFIENLNFKNFGAGNATLGTCTNWAIIYDNPVPEGTVAFNHYQVTDTTNGRCAFSNASGNGTNTMHFIKNEIGGQSATNTTGCSGQGIRDGGSYGLVQDNNIYAFAIPVRVQGIGHKIDHNNFDNAGCAQSGGVATEIQYGIAGSAANVGSIIITANTGQFNATLHSVSLFGQAHDSTATLSDTALIGNVNSLFSSPFTTGALIQGTPNCTNTPNLGTGCYEYGNLGLTGVVTCGSSATGWQLENIFAGCTSSAQTANLGTTALFTPTLTKAIMVTCQILITTAAGTSSTLPQCVIIYTDLFTNTAQSMTVTPILGASATVDCNGTAVTNPPAGTSCQGTTGVIVPKPGTAVNYSTTGYASVNAATMQYQAFVRATAQ
jgi:hypothetical protein